MPCHLCGHVAGCTEQIRSRYLERAYCRDLDACKQRAAQAVVQPPPAPRPAGVQLEMST
jgi:hypothetical protein